MSPPGLDSGGNWFMLVSCIEQVISAGQLNSMVATAHTAIYLTVTYSCHT